MSIEQDLNSIAVSLSTIAKMMGFLVDQKQADSMPLVTVAPESGVVAAVKLVEEKPKHNKKAETTVAAVEFKTYTLADLKTMAQRIAESFEGDTSKITKFVDFVKLSVCKNYGVARLSEVPETSVQESAQALIDYAKGEGIDVN